MAFDGPTPFDGDPAYDFVHEIEDQSPARVRAALARAFKATRAEYVEVDEGVWAWCAAELVAVARGRPPRPLPPEPFLSAALSLSDPEALVAPALKALAVVADAERSEVAQLWEESGDGTLTTHLRSLRTRLQATPKPVRPRKAQRQPRPTAGDLVAAPDGAGGHFLLLYVGRFPGAFGHTFAVVQQSVRALPALGPTWAPRFVPRLFGTLLTAIADGSWTILGNMPHLLERAPREPIYYHSKLFHQRNDEIGAFGSAESLDGSLRALTRAEAKRLGLDDPSFQNCGEPDILVDYLTKLRQTWKT